MTWRLKPRSAVRLPPAWDRLRRRRTSLAATAVVAALALAGSQIGLAAQGRLTAEVNAHWRGAYDILVRPKVADLGIAKTNGLVEPNYVALASHGGIDEAQVDAIRRIPGVEIAAPIGWVGMVSGWTTTPSVGVTSLPSQATLYAVDLRLTVSDGVAPRLLDQDSLRVLLQGSPPGHPPLVLTDDNYGDSGVNSKGVEQADFGTADGPPPVQAPILAVDPVAERALLGSQGTFLQPLINLEQRDDLTAATTDPNIVLPGYNQRLDIAILAQGSLPQRARPVIPIVVSSRVYSPIEMAISVRQLGHPVATVPSAGAPSDILDEVAQAAGPGSTPIGQAHADVTADLRPFRLNTMAIAWPGDSVLPGDVGSHPVGTGVYSATLIGRPAYAAIPPPRGSRAIAFRIAPQGIVPAGGPSAAGNSAAPGPERVAGGTEQSYRSVTFAPVPVAQGFVAAGRDDQPFVFAPIATYDLDALHLPRDPLDYAPYGAYDPPDTTLIADPSGKPVTPVSMNPTLDPAGLLQVPPAGIVDIHAAELLRGPAPIDAVRVRVAGITEYGSAAIAKVEQVAAAIEAMGLDADVVAASSPQTVDIYVPAYDTSTSPPGALGWIEQHWTTLGAAVLVTRSIGAADLTLLLLALGAAAIIVVGTRSIEADARRREAAILMAVGWPRITVIRWQVAEAVVAAVAVLVVGLIGWLASSREIVGLIAAGGGAAVFVASGALGAILLRPSLDPVAVARRQPSTRPWGRLIRGPMVGGVASFGLRSVTARPVRSLVTTLGLGLSAAAIATGLMVLVRLSGRVGPTLLAGALTARLAPYEVALLLLVGAGALAFTLLTLQADRAARSAELRVLAAVGWRPRQVRGLLWWGRVWICLPAAVIAAVLGVVLTGPLVGAGSVAVVAALAGLLALSPIVWAGLVGRRMAVPGRAGGDVSR